jgi:hypothetical protein
MKRTTHRKNRNMKAKSKNKTMKKIVIKGGGIKEQKAQLIKTNFRNMFLKVFKKTQTVESYNNGFKSNQLGINTLIPITNEYNPINKQDNSPTTPLIGFVPLLTVIFKRSDDLIFKKSMIDMFIKYKGNINLLSYVKNISALSCAIELQDKPLILYLLKNGADVNILTSEQLGSFNSIMQDSPIMQVEDEAEDEVKGEDEVKVQKLILPTPEYTLDFWTPILSESELLNIKQGIADLIQKDKWSVCNINQTMIPTYFFPTKNEPYELYGSYFSDLDIDFSQFNIILCASLILFGIISHKMIGQDYNIVFKGGKAIQLVLAGIPEMMTYKTEDIDVLISPTSGVPYNEAIVKNLAGHIAYLIKWCLTDVSVQAPNPDNIRANQYIFKLSYIKANKKPDYRTKTMIEDYKQFSDIDFKEMTQPFFEKVVEYPFFISELNQTVLFRCPNIGSILDEKLFYYIKYFKFKQMIEERTPIVEPGYEGLKVVDCNRFLEKFKRAIVALNKGLIRQRFPESIQDELLVKERKSLLTRVERLLGEDNLQLSSLIMNSLTI